MLVIPAIDLKDGKCVRLRQGRFDETTVFSEDPVAIAGKWREQGARRLHMVDLDGAVAGAPVNAGIVKAVVGEYPDLPVQIGGGIRNLETAQSYIEAGVRFVIIGTAAVRELSLPLRFAIAFRARSLSASTRRTAWSPPKAGSR